MTQWRRTMPDAGAGYRKFCALEESNVHRRHSSHLACGIDPFRCGPNVRAEQTHSDMIDVKLPAGIIGHMLKAEFYDGAARGLGEAFSENFNISI